MGQDRSRSATSTRRRGQGIMGTEHGGPRSGVVRGGSQADNQSKSKCTFGIL